MPLFIFIKIGTYMNNENEMNNDTSLPDLDNLKKSIELMKNDTLMVREGFFVDLLIAYHQIEANLKQQNIELNNQLTDFKKELNSDCEQAINTFEKTIADSKKLIQDTNHEFKLVGKAIQNLDNSLDEKSKKLLSIMNDFEKKALDFQKMKMLFLVFIPVNVFLILLLAVNLVIMWGR